MDDVIGFVDSSLDSADKLFMDKEIIEPSLIKTYEFDYIVIFTDKYFNEIAERICKRPNYHDFEDDWNKYAKAKEISIFDYSNIIFSALISIILFGVIPDYLSIIGYIIIFIVSLYIKRINIKYFSIK